MADKQDVEKILQQLSQLHISVSSISDRVGKLEAHNSFPDQDDVIPETIETSDQSQRSIRHPTTSGPSSAPLPAVADIQKDFERIRDSLQRTPVPDGYRVHDSAVGIKQENKQALKILSKCARFTETALKIVNQVSVTDNAVNISESEVNCLFTCLAAQINFLQNEYTGLVVKSTFDDETARIFKQFENNSSTFSDSSLRNIRVAAELSSLSSRNTQQRNRNTNTNMRGRSADRGFYRGQRRAGWRNDFAGRRFDARPPFHRPMNYEEQAD